MKNATMKMITKELIVSKKFLSYLAIVLVFALAITSYSDVLIKWYDGYIMPVLSLFKPNIFSFLVICVLIGIVGYDVRNKWINRFRFDGRLCVAILCAVVVIVAYRLSGRYEYVSWLWEISYVDVISLTGLTYVVLAMVNAIRIASDVKKENEDDVFDGLIGDWPIEKKSEDIFNLSGEAHKIAKEILSLNKTKTFSIAVTAQWGAGKTSFLNLIKDNFSENDIEIVYFNPRDSKSYQEIQEDFFAQLACVLSKYDSRFSNIIKDYMSSLQLIDNRGLVEKIVNVYRIWDKEDLKGKLKDTFEHLEKKVLILIDDFDRLSKEEILEVLKLIDSNAAFSSLIFLTAYDKNQVNKSLGESYKSEDACFVDKFFNLEFVIPPRPYSFITNYMGETLCTVLSAKDSEASTIIQTLKNKEDILKDYLPTLRDAKRFINQFVMDYKLVRGDVNLEEYILVQLIKYKHPDEYTKLFRRRYVEKEGFLPGRQLYYLRKDIDDSCKIKPLLYKLFSIQNDRGGYGGKSYKHIFDAQSFDNYFMNQIYGTMRLVDMKSIFSGSIEEVHCKIDEWVKSESQLNDIIAYLYSLDMNGFNSGNQYIRFADVVTYIALKRPESNAYWLFMRLIHIPNLDGYERKYSLVFDKYKKRLLHTITDVEMDNDLRLIRLVHTALETNDIKEEEQLIKDTDIWPIIKQQFLRICPEFDDLQTMKKWLYDCIDYVEHPSCKIILDSECLEACKQHIQAHPDEYVLGFVFLGGVSSDPEFNTIACEPFWEQIFGSEDQFEQFILDCETKGVDRIGTVRNFWELYKANNYGPIEFENQGYVQDKIEHGLEDERKQLEQLKTIHTSISEIPDNVEILSDEDIQLYHKMLSIKLEELNKVNLNIALNGEIRRELERKMQMFK